MKKKYITAVLHNNGEISIHEPVYEMNILERYNGYGCMTGEMTVTEAIGRMQSWRKTFWKWLSVSKA